MHIYLGYMKQFSPEKVDICTISVSHGQNLAFHLLRFGTTKYITSFNPSLTTHFYLT